MSAIDLLQFLETHPVAEPKRQGFDFDIEDIRAALKAIGKAPHPSALYKALSGMDIEKNRRGYYDAPAVAALLGWYRSPSRYASYEKYIKAVGQSLYDAVANHYQETA